MRESRTSEASEGSHPDYSLDLATLLNVLSTQKPPNATVAEQTMSDLWYADIGVNSKGDADPWSVCVYKKNFFIFGNRVVCSEICGNRSFSNAAL